ncbi:HesB/IscA family protein [Marinomonas mediterranea]|jgi:Iron-sulfur cluster assembly accessory protein|uniref:Iron-sulfur cluster assembly accessory protein n=1 Tax=Marinomonas mediterranea (strain ATCC 700492 / JCM 21426 / NBRC 103028 / MMB-1) TaxID=717774 RepID=F2JUS2_MARM1|nr:iron-sulfur cluster assembly accessory protein [Marinomonas mediterranea]ADZ90487.1 iron-sulfur cluster assembly accessory protein [Marinomonas mediterranea MMB-1]WCN08540.1 iron-sulfur cluster assembly accessory protein [Marinomonas mediterranea]WCN12594.1 iron-sulfur cluster assembly accessory protein [Marinomonas mediterranea]WCN16666.1 iron-sulfur cluster assembly accessory protein [Marinomonas mediterranea MMB-1]
MTTATFDPNQAVTLTAVAQKYFSAKLTAQPEKLIRLSTKESGCTGFAYVLDIVAKAEDSDEVLTFENGLEFAVAQGSLELLKGTEIDLVREGVNQVVKFNNPNVIAECGCGESFSVN